MKEKFLLSGDCSDAVSSNYLYCSPISNSWPSATLLHNGNTKELNSHLACYNFRDVRVTSAYLFFY